MPILYIGQKNTPAQSPLKRRFRCGFISCRVESTSDRVRDQVVGRGATSDLPFTHSVSSVSSLPWVLPQLMVWMKEWLWRGVRIQMLG